MKRKKSARAGSAQASENPVKDIGLSILKGSLAGLIITLVAILLLAFVLKALVLDDGVIPFFNQLIKIASIMFASINAAKSATGPAWLKGILAGVAYVIMGFFVFSLIQGEMGMLSVLFSDMLAGAAVGLISVIIYALVPKRNKKKA